MAYKRTTRKTGKNSRSTTTHNTTNGSHTQSASTSGGKGTTRTTVSNNTKTGTKITRSFTDGNGYVHRKTIFSTAGANRESRLSKKRDAEFGKALIKLFSGNKKPTSARTKKPESLSLGNLIVLGLLIWGAYVIFT